MGVGGRAPSALPRLGNSVSIVQEAGWAQGRSVRNRKISSAPPRFDQQTTQAVASRYADWAMLAHEDVMWRCLVASGLKIILVIC